MTISDVMSMYIPDRFGKDEMGEYTNEVWEVFDQLPEETQHLVATGASKFVFPLNEKEVVKIPFDGMWQDGDWDEFDDEDNDDYKDGLGFTPYDNNYCEIETCVYADAVAAGVEMFFASTKYVGTSSNNKPIYVSEKVNNWYHGWKPTPSKGSVEKAEQTESELPVDWLAVAYEVYGDDLVNRLLDFISDNGIDDLHRGNLGIRQDGTPCILDYSGFDY